MKFKAVMLAVLLPAMGVMCSENIRKNEKFSISALDKHMQTVPADDSGISYLPPDRAPFELSGLYWYNIDGKFRRLPLAGRDVLPVNVDRLADCPAGAKVRFRSDASKIHIRVRRAAFDAVDSMNYLVRAGFDLYVGDPGKEQFYRTSRSKVADTCFTALMFDARPEVPGGKVENKMRSFTLYFPLYHPVESLEIGLPPGCKAAPPLPLAEDERPIVVYGTSITQGACASRTGLAWTNMVSRKIGRHVYNFGFSDGGKCELPVAGVLASIENPLLYIIDCEANLGDAYTEKLEEFLPVLIKKHPQVPILVMSRYRMTYWKLHPLNVEKQKALIEKLSARGAKVHFLDCSDILGLDYAETLVDGLHANDMAFKLITEAVYNKIKTVIK